MTDTFSLTKAEDITEALCVSKPTLSLTYEGDGGVKEIDLPVFDMEKELSNKLLLETALKSLSENEGMIIKYRYFGGLTQSKTAELLGMTQVQVSRSEKQILKKLKFLLS